MKDYKVCKKGTGKAIGFNGCGNNLKKVLFNKSNFKYGLGISCGCYSNWLLNTEEGKKSLEKTRIKAKKEVEQAKNPKRKYIKWIDKPTHEMIAYVQEHICNPYIRFRDIESGFRCISSGGVIEHAGHCFSVGSCAGLRFNIQNIHGQRGMENTHKHGDFQNYKEGLIARHGKKYFEQLEQLKIKANSTKQLYRDEVIRIGKTYEYLMKHKIICFHHDEFESWKNTLNK